MTAYDFPPPTIPTHTATCPVCDRTTKPCISPARAAYALSLHKCGTRQRRANGLNLAKRSSADTADDVEFILDWDNPWTDPATLAERLGYATTEGLYIALKRSGRHDLLAQLARNARVAS